ncbi:class I fructose-bisphosphate aldolase [Candidatus Nanosalina sp. VS9-1]|uniref:class I fructose-bisphosphate aldolase n=1 Tax=Candidatus Nanosalina sp. VS9-1 TaxID=3388566 RepID=UPI0039DF4D80
MKDFDDSPIVRNGNSLILAYDHGTEHGPVDFEPMPESAEPKHVFRVSEHDAVTAIALQKGNAEYYRKWQEDTGKSGAPLLVKLNGNSNLAKREDYYSPKQCSVRYAVEELDADAIGYTMYAGSIHEDEMWKEFREVQEQARKYGIPVVMWSYPRGKGIEENTEYSGQKDPEVVAYGARLGLELGADMVKCKYPGEQRDWEQLEDVVGEMKTVMSGGSKRSDKAFLEDVNATIEVGGNGLAVGRNIFQREDPESLLDKLEGVIFEGKNPEEVTE